MLHLQDIVVMPEDFATTQLPLLRLVRFANAGVAAPAALEALRLKCPKLEERGCVSYKDPSSVFDAKANETLSKREREGTLPKRERARLFGFPDSDLAGLSLGIITMTALRFTQNVLVAFSTHNPSSFHKAYLINVPTFFVRVWALISKVLLTAQQAGSTQIELVAVSNKGL